MVILGIDPGTGRTGYGVIKKDVKGKDKNKNGFELVDYGCIVTTKDNEMGERLYFIQKELSKLFKKHQPDCLAVEQLFFGVNSRTVMAVGQAKGVIMVTAASFKVPIFEYTGLQAKLVVAGHGRADKKIVQKKVRSWLGVNSRTAQFSAKDHAWDDAADALAVAICHAIKGEL